MKERVMIVYPEFMDAELRTKKFIGESYVFTDINKGWDFQEYLNENMDLSGVKGKGQLYWTNNSIEIDLPKNNWDEVVKDWSFPKENNQNIKIRKLINTYAEKHELAKVLGSEYISQEDEAQVDAIELVCDIFDLYTNEQKEY